ncbi:MAG: hypothetical protein IPG34_00090 [Rhodocyclaceae bacterium]|nr:hypothetical protein [Rhodocyclaceae bacterium]
MIPILDLANANVTTLVPIIRTREMESSLRLRDGQIAVLGGLMQDEISDKHDGIPGTSRYRFGC